MRSRGRLRLRWRDVVEKDLKGMGLRKKDTDERIEWGRRIRTADLSFGIRLRKKMLYSITSGVGFYTLLDSSI